MKESLELKKPSMEDTIQDMERALLGRGTLDEYEKYKEPGYHYRFVGTAKNKDLWYLKLKYEYCLDENNARITMNGSIGPQVMMRIPNEMKAELDKLKAKKNQKLLRNIDPKNTFTGEQYYDQEFDVENYQRGN